MCLCEPGGLQGCCGHRFFCLAMPTAHHGLTLAAAVSHRLQAFSAKLKQALKDDPPPSINVEDIRMSSGKL